ncbi:MAG: PhoH family protein [Deltaproteobacteria bacterium]|uniref:PhoH-like protein n=1 Tax=Candidatus Zymogenus saltonus TaxID=2844893 RepID=A0A9D8KDB1_9DELT|nr:PhoH family protein [Candidatus Zymogenus saltonus]
MSLDSTTKIDFEDNNLVRSLFGEHNSHLTIIEEDTGTKISARGATVTITGDKDEVEISENLLIQLYDLLKKGYPVYSPDIDFALRILKANRKVNLKEIFLDTVYISSKKRSITPKSLAQKKYIDSIRQFDIVFGIGPAGTGKTYLAMAMAMDLITRGKVNRVILTRPAVEAGEKLGFLPGDIYEKINPYLRPLYDALHDMMDFEQAQRLVHKGIIEVAPLAFMRGRTLNDSFIVLDEAQNTTSEQMKMFLTRLGFNSKTVITGDITQIDLPPGKISGLVEAKKILSDIEGIDFCYFNEKDVVRHRLVREIIKAYEKLDKDLESNENIR